MKPPAFAYCAPERVDEVLALLAQHGADARLLAGGQSLVPLMNLRMVRPEVLIDLNRCADLGRIERTAAGVNYGAMVRQIEAERSALTGAHCPLIARALAQAGPIAVRTRATVGGTLAHADRAAELPGVAVALDATMVLERRSGRREVPAREFFQGDMTTVVESDEMLRAVVFPTIDAAAFADFFEVGLRQEGIAIAGLAAYVAWTPGGGIAAARLAAIGVESAPVRLTTVEAALKGQTLTPALIVEARHLATAAVDPIDDTHATAKYRKHVTGALVKKALEGARDGTKH
ncbi:MAG: xanthine dehydrogenase family protein subunit M [Armatimonadetes bacterium]|nr:xanthine dehydrogenase family protein subunit M [Armatimonadota bacterium]